MGGDRRDRRAPRSRLRTDDRVRRRERAAARRMDRTRRSRYDLRHTFATFALRAGISTFDLSRFMGSSLTMIDRRVDVGWTSRRAAGRPLGAGGQSGTDRSLLRLVDVWWTSSVRSAVQTANGTGPYAATFCEASDGLEPSTPSLPSITRDTVSPANQAGAGDRDASRDVARVVSDVSVLCPRLVVCSYNREHRVWMRIITTMNTCASVPGGDHGFRACLGGACLDGMRPIAS
jgi:hypothetical protein